METAYYMELTGEDLKRVKILRTADPLEELQSAVHRLVLGPGMDVASVGWARRTAAALGSTGALVMEVLNSGIGVCTELGLDKQRRGVEFDGLADSVRSVPMRTWEMEVDELAKSGIDPGWPGSMASDPVSIQQFANVVGHLQDVAVRPYWPVLRATAAAHGDALAELWALGGVDAVLRNVHPSVSWDDPILTVRQDRTGLHGRTCPHLTAHEYVGNREPVSLRGRGLVLVPSVLATGVSITNPGGGDEGQPWELSFPVPWNWSISGDSQHRALADLLGSTRATVLDALLPQALTTSELARLVHISPASASEHATVLRSAGLITSNREGARVYHSLTPMGLQLATGGSGVTFTGTVADQVST